MTTALGVAFRPGGAAPFLETPAGEIQDAIVPLGNLWGQAGVELGERLATDATPAARFQRLERALLGRLERARRCHPAVAAALGAFGDGVGAPDVGAVAERVGLSRRRLIQVFRSEVGLPPKLYCRVRRFGAVLQATSGARAVAWAAVAQACGYYDQAHLIRDFREFAGASPTDYLAARGDGPNPFHLTEPG